MHQLAAGSSGCNWTLLFCRAGNVAPCARKCEAVCDSSENRQPALADLSELQLQHVITRPSVSNLAKSPDLEQHTECSVALHKQTLVTGTNESCHSSHQPQRNSSMNLEWPHFLPSQQHCPEDCMLELPVDISWAAVGSTAETLGGLICSALICSRCEAVSLTVSVQTRDVFK